MNLELLRFIIGTVVLAAGLLTFAMEVFGSYRFEFVLNRMHAAALGGHAGNRNFPDRPYHHFRAEFYQPEDASGNHVSVVRIPCFLPFDFPSGGYDGRNPEGAL